MFQNFMSIKESFRYQNHLDRIISILSSYVRNRNNAIEIKEVHYKSKSNSEALDETLDTTSERTYNCKVDDVCFLITKLVEQKLFLSLAIEKAKRNLRLKWVENNIELTLDSAIIYNKNCRELADNLKYLIDLKSSETKFQGKDFKFNLEGNQIQYFYNIETKTTIDFDRDKVNNMYKKLLSKSDIISTQIESAMLEEVVEFIPIYDIHDSVEEIVSSYLKDNK